MKSHKSLLERINKFKEENSKNLMFLRADSYLENIKQTIGNYSKGTLDREEMYNEIIKDLETIKEGLKGYLSVLWNNNSKNKARDISSFSDAYLEIINIYDYFKNSFSLKNSYQVGNSNADQ